MNLRFHVKEPGKAYIADRLWMPKSKVREETLKTALEFTVPSPTGQIAMKMWEETKHHILCPREFLPPEVYRKYKFPFIDLRPEFSRVTFKDLVKPRNEEQEKAWEALKKNDNGILNLSCGKGKTKLALKKIAQRGVPTLVVVPDGGILSQWKESIFGNPARGILPGLEFEGGLGIIQGPVFDWAHPVTLALVTTLWMRIQDGAIPEQMYRYFGQIIYDEVHQIGAPKFSLTAKPFFGDRIGLTATLTREDGLDPIYRYHIGEPFYSDLKQDLIPRIYFEKTRAFIDVEKARDKLGQINTGLLRSELGRNYDANVYRYWRIRQAMDNGRKILALSHSKNQLKLFHAIFPDSALIIGDVEQSERLDILRNSRVCFCIARLGTTGVDDDRLDTLFWLTPFTSRNALQQSMGRVQRPLEGKPAPVMVAFEEFLTPTIHKMVNKLRQRLLQWRYKSQNAPPDDTLPKTFPPEVEKIYLDTLKGLADDDIADEPG